eukprot:5169579-Heterocapsa_arctica.AAC.1
MFAVRRVTGSTYVRCVSSSRVRDASIISSTHLSYVSASFCAAGPSPWRSPSPGARQVLSDRPGTVRATS